MNIENTTFQSEAYASVIAELGARRRSDGILSQRLVDLCRMHGIGLAFDPLQLGWVLANCEDDLAPRQTDRSGLAFRSWASRDAATLARLLSAEAVWRYLPETFSGPIDQNAAEALIELSRADHHLVLAVTQNDVPIGQVRLLYEEPDSAEVSYWLGAQHWGRGYASEMVKAFCDTCLRDHPDLDRLFAKVHEGNTASQRVLQKAGFEQASDDGDWLLFERTRPQGAPS
ncbi:MAG: GNAT family N-acetyltransferase [Paracoccaceae bacterium]